MFLIIIFFQSAKKGMNNYRIKIFEIKINVRENIELKILEGRGNVLRTCKNIKIKSFCRSII